ncbi:MAG: guanylate kinase [Vulcanimicrobiota bacterium]
MLFLLDGPSATGKTTLLRQLLASCPELTFCRRLTTRPPRAGELDNPTRDYDFVDMAEFRRRQQAGELALSRDFEFGMSYGLPRRDVDEALAGGGSVLALVDLGTAPGAREIWPGCVCILLCAPLSELERRLRGRGGHSDEQIAERLGNAASILARAPDYDYVVVNRPPNCQRALNLLQWIVRQQLPPGGHSAAAAHE